MAIHAQSFWNAAHGKGFYNTYEGGDHFGRHFAPIQYVLLWFYSLSPSVLVLHGLNILLFCLSIFPLYGILKNLFDENVSFLFLLFFYLHPVIYSIPTGAFRDTSILPFFFLSAFYFYKKEKFLPFMAFVLLCDATKEIVALPMALFGFISLWEKRSWKWAAVPFLASLLWFVVAVKWVMPRFSQSSLGHEWKAHLGYLGGNLKEIAANLAQPDFFKEKIFFKKKAVYFLRMLLPFGIFIPFLSVYWVLAIPDALGILFSSMESTASAGRPYGILIYMALFLSFAHVVSRSRIFDGKWGARIMPKMMPLVFSCFLILPAFNYFLQRSQIHIKMNARKILTVKFGKSFEGTYRKIVELIAPGASVSAPPIVANHLTERDVLHLDISFKVDYLVLNEKQLTRDIQKQLKEFSYQNIFSENGWTVYKRGIGVTTTLAGATDRGIPGAAMKAAANILRRGFASTRRRFYPPLA